MSRIRRLRAFGSKAARIVVGVLFVLSLLVVAVLAALETGWAKNELRALLVRQANQYLTATLEIDSLGGSIFRGLDLEGIRLSRDGHAIVSIDRVALSYSIRELWQHGIVIRRIALTHPTFFIARQGDGRWNMAALVRSEARQQERTGPGRPIHIDRIEVRDGTVDIADPLEFGAAHVPSRYDALNLTLSFDYQPVTWRLTFEDASWTAPPPDLTVTHIGGALARGDGGWTFDHFLVATPRSRFSVDGRIETNHPSRFALHVAASRFDFEEWGGVLHGIRNIAVESAFDVQLTGPSNHLQAVLQLAGTGGGIHGTFALDTTVPGWHGTGSVDLSHLDLARWLNRPDRPSDITGAVGFDLALHLGMHFPSGRYTFDGAHAAFMEYGADNVHVAGDITDRDALVRHGTAVAYGAGVTLDGGSIGLDDPFPFHFAGTMTGLDLRRVPPSVPVPRVDSMLAFAYDVTGRFSHAYIDGRAEFQPSRFLGAAIRDGTIGTIDTSASPITWGGEGEIDGVDLERFGEGFDVAWMRDPAYAGTVSGRFHVEGSGSDRETLTMDGGGRVTRASLFHGRFSGANVTIGIGDGSLTTSFDGRFDAIDPAVALGNPRYSSTLAGTADVHVAVADLLTRTPTIDDYDISGTIALEPSSVHGMEVTNARVDGSLRGGVAMLSSVEVSAPGLDGRGHGTIVATGDRPWDFEYAIARADLAHLQPLVPGGATGTLEATGRATGPWSQLHLDGMAMLNDFSAPNVQALTTSGGYDFVVPSGDIGRAAARIDARTTFASVVGQSIQEGSGTLAFNEGRFTFDLRAVQPGQRTATVAGAADVDFSRQEADLDALTLSVGSAPWRLERGDVPTRIKWTGGDVTVAPVVFVSGPASDERIAIAGTWRPAGGGTLTLKGTNVRIETLAGAFEQPPRYAGRLDLEATLTGSRADPIVDGDLTITNGRIRNFAYQQLAGRAKFRDGMFDIDLRLDQGPDVWMTATGTLPYALFNRSLPERPINVAIKSSPINLGLIEGLTTVVRNVSGQLTADVRAIGTSRDPHFNGAITVDNAQFLVAATGERYQHGRAAFRLARDRVAVDMLHIEDSSGHPLDVRGGLGTHELTVGRLEVDATARNFDIMRNEFGRVAIDASLHAGGHFEQPLITGDLTITGTELHVDEILNRVLFQPYSTQEAAVTPVDAVEALNPWDRLGLDVALHVPRLRLVGDDVQVTPGTPIGLGNINMRVGGDLYLYKDPGQQLFVSGSLDSVSGTYVFQGRRFDIDESESSINFVGDLNPNLYVSVTRSINGVLARVTLAGPMRNPELRLTSVPPLPSSDVLSLIVFNASTNDLTAAQQQELAVRAGTLAASFLATPIVTAIQSELGLETLQVEPGEFGTGAKLTVGEEIWPGLVARFSRQFGSEPYDEATIEYYLSRILRLRATFSDAASLAQREPFRRIERAGIDLLFFFSF